MSADNVTIGLAFLAGFISFISPCVLPLVPAYVSYMGGRATTEAGKENTHSLGTFLHGVFFVLGFTLFFVSFGLLTAAASSFLTTIGIDIPTVITRLGGLAIILFGLYVMNWLNPVFRWLQSLTQSWQDEGNRLAPLVFTVLVGGGLFGYLFWAFGATLPWSLAWALLTWLGLAALFRKPLNEAAGLSDFWRRAVQRVQYALASDTRKLDFQRDEKQGYFSSLGMGVVFSAGWTPCIGPVFGGVLSLAAQSAASGDSLLPAAMMLTAYSMGLGIPFLLAALAFNQSVSVMNRVKRHMHTVEMVSGLLLIVIGVAVLTGGLTRLTTRINSGELGEFSIRMEACAAGVASDRIGFNRLGTCLTDGVDKLEDTYVQAVDRGQYTSSVTQYIFSGEYYPEDVPVGTQEGMRAPDFTLQTLDGETVSLEDFRGQAVLLNFWTSWCGPCRIEMPEFQRLYDSQRAKGFTVLAVNDTLNGDSPERAVAFLEEIGVTFPAALDQTREVVEAYRVVGMPTSYLIDGNGIIVMSHAGPLTGQTLREVLSTFEVTITAEDEAAAHIQ